MESHYHSLSELQYGDILILLITCITLSLTSCTGSGGGSLCIPIFILFLHFNTKQAIPLGNITVLGGALTNIIYNFNKRHPTIKKFSLIDWDVIAMMEPATMLGALLGAYFHKIMSPKLTTVLLMFLLAVISSRMLYKGFYVILASHYNRSQNDIVIDNVKPDVESDTFTEKEIAIDMSDVSDYTIDSPNFDSKSDDKRTYQYPVSLLEKKAIIRHGMIETPISLDKIEYSPVQTYGSINDRDVGAYPEVTTPWEIIILLLVLGIGACIINLLKGFMIDSFFWPIAATAILVAFIVTIAVILGRIVVKRHLISPSENFGDTDGIIIRWDTYNIVTYPALCLLAGVMAGSFGVGGGIIKAPLMIEIGMHPHAASVTSTTMILFTSAIAATSYLGDNSLIADYGIFMFGLGVVSNVLAQKVVNPIIMKFGHASLITVLLGAVIAVAAVLLLMEDDHTN